LIWLGADVERVSPPSAAAAVECRHTITTELWWCNECEDRKKNESQLCVGNTSFTAVAIIDESTVVMTQNDDADAGESLFGIRYWIAHTHAHAHTHTRVLWQNESHIELAYNVLRQ
jgi:hypothetical protein